MDRESLHDFRSLNFTPKVTVQSDNDLSALHRYQSHVLTDLITAKKQDKEIGFPEATKREMQELMTGCLKSRKDSTRVFEKQTLDAMREMKMMISSMNTIKKGILIFGTEKNLEQNKTLLAHPVSYALQVSES